MNISDFVKRADEILGLADAVIPTMSMTAMGSTQYDAEKFGLYRASGLSFLANTFGESHPYYREFAEETKAAWTATTKKSRGILLAAREEVANGWAVTATGLVSAQIFADFLDMAGYLLAEGYKDASAVITGSTLEEHLRQLARKNGVPTEAPAKSGTGLVPKKADTLNAELVKANVYGVLQQKNVTAWLDLRNRAAHGKYSEYDANDVRLMHQGVTQFMSQFSV